LLSIAIVIPVLDDWDALSHLLRDIDALALGEDAAFHLFIIDDGSTTPLPERLFEGVRGATVASIELVRLTANLGHQRAIAVGLVVVARRERFDYVMVMDSDGEDRPAGILDLLTTAVTAPDTAVLASRGKRHEGSTFQLGYAAYKLLFRVLTGKQINFGNFSLLPMRAVNRLIFMPELWNNLPATILKSRIPLVRCSIERGVRYTGTSKMNSISLVVHGLGAISVYVDTVFMRMLAAAMMITAVLIAGLLTSLSIKLFTDLAAPSWTTTVMGALLALLFQTIILVIVTTVTLLAGRSSRPMVPFSDAEVFVAGTERIWPTKAAASRRKIAARPCP
jgi:hypothetical protein